VCRLKYREGGRLVEELVTEWLETERKEVIFNEIMITYGQELLQLVYSYVKDKTIAEDLTQEIFVKCYHSLHTYKQQSKLKTWLWRIAINHCKDYLKSWYNKNVIKIDGDFQLEEDHRENVEQAVIQKEEDYLLSKAVINLPINYREVIFLYYFEELTIKEIASVINVKENTIKTRMRRAKELLKGELEGGKNGKKIKKIKR
jgi:RNA polymerase sigma-70 factor (ECF subfamily)